MIDTRDICMSVVFFCCPKSFLTIGDTVCYTGNMKSFIRFMGEKFENVKL